MQSTQKKRFLILMLLFWAVIYPNTAHAFWHNLKSPYPTHNLKVNQAELNCPSITPRPQDLNFTSIYKDGDTAKSVEKFGSRINYEKQIKDIKTFENIISKWVENLYLTPNQIVSQCIKPWLTTWAEDNALLNIESTSQGQAVRKWHLAAISSHYLQIKDVGLFTNADKQKIEIWLESMANQVMADYPPNDSRLSRNNNHQYWAAWSVMITGVALNNRKFYKYGIQNFKKAMQQVGKNGSLPLELDRKSKAFHYHLFALSPLVMIAETAHENGYNLYKYRSGALLNLIKFTLNNLENNQRGISSLTGVEQNLGRTITAGQLAWLIPYNNAHNDVIAKKWIKKLSPMKQKRIGGNLTIIYSE